MFQAAEQRPIDGVTEDLTRQTPLAKLVYRMRGNLVAPAIFAAGAVAWGAHPRPLDLIAGGLTFLVGCAGRAWSQCHLGYRLNRRMHLTTCGPYRWVRNPVYIANTLLVVGTTLMTGNHVLVAAATLLCGSVYALTVRYEEGRLARTYGHDYIEYYLATPRWIPTNPGSAVPPCDCKRSWTDVAKAEWQVSLLLVPILLELVRW